MDQDTDPRQRDRYFELLRAMSPAERLRKAADLTRAVRLYGREVARRLFGEHPALQP
jgi:hypothetical protein